jgi:hypothetical protein
MHAKFMSLGMHVPHVIPHLLTKWHTLIQHILAAILFLSPAMLKF